MDPAATAVWPAGGRAYEAYEDYARSYLPVSAHPPGHPGTANLAWQPPQPGLDTDRQHEDTKSGVLWSDKSGGGGVGAMAAQDPLLAHQAHQWLSQYWNTASPWNIDAKMQIDSMENLGTGAYGRPQSSTSLSPPTSGLVVPQPLNARLPGQAMLGGVGVTGRKYPCKMCPQAFNSKADLQLHTQIHLREPKPYKCHSCGKAFANSSYLSQHTRIHLGIKPYRCEICQRKFTQLSHLQQHIRTHTGDKPYKCRIPGCTKAFSQLSNLQSHSRCHQTDKPYKCNSCYKCFHDEASLLDHIPKHKESKHLKTHICSYCGKSYTQETYLAKHMQKHSDRSDKRPPIVAAGTTNPASAMGALGSLAASSEHYWPKMDGYGYGHQLMDQRLADPRDYDPRGLHPGNHQMTEELRHHGHGWPEAAQNPALSPNSVTKTTSAFSPLQSSMLQSSSGFGMPNPRTYPAFYDPISFPQPPTKVNFGEPSGNSSAGPQLLSLTKIKNYAHNPHNDGIFKSLTSLSQDKSLNHLGQLGTAAQ